MPRHIAVARRVLEGGGFSSCELPARGYMPYESNLEFPLRFMIDTQVVGCNWIELLVGKYRLRQGDGVRSRCQYEVDVAWNAFVSHAAEGEWSKVAPLRVMSFDIECSGRKGIFPEAEHDPVIQIATMVQRQGDSKPFVRTVMTLNTCANIVGSTVYPFYGENMLESERRLLTCWAELVREVDPDIITGYNIVNFDLPYLLNRATALKIQSFPFLGRIRGVRTQMKDTKFSSKAYGTRESKLIAIEGRCQFDVLQILQRDYKLRSYTLNAVSAHFLGEQKEDVHYSIIGDLQNGNSQTRRRLAVYCLKVRKNNH